MEKEVQQQHLNNILGDIAAIQSAIEGQSFEDFRGNEQTKERVYALLQEIGEIARELTDIGDYGDQLSLAKLASLRNARYNQEAEISHQGTWAIITNDLPLIADEIEESELYHIEKG